jgi:prepilin-type N-terminal cleavage/methylation domain-containing protein/prepilin-type processing-associated H-X9-DG protein
MDRQTSHHPRICRPGGGCAFTLIELLVVVAIIGLLVSILVPSLSAARRQAQAVKCLSHLRSIGQGITIYVNENLEVLPPSRLPKLGGCDAWSMIYGRKKYRPTFIAVLSSAVGVPPFDDPMDCGSKIDMHGQRGDRQNYSYPVYYCPSTPEWTDERNGSYGYNYQFLGNSRLHDENAPQSYKNWPVQLTWVRHPGNVVLAGDGMGTAAWWAPDERLPYDPDDNRKEARCLGNEGFNLDPPWVDPIDGEMANLDSSPQSRSAADPRHSRKANILWVDGHGSAHGLEQLGYRFKSDGGVGYDGENSLWSLDGRDVPWTNDYRAH